MTSQLDRLPPLAGAARPINFEDWGSERQIDAQNAFFDAVKPLLTRKQWDELEDYCNGATIEEMIDEALRVVGVRS